MRKSKKAMLFVLASGMVFQFGCLGQYFSFVAQGLPGTIVAEWLLDNDSVFDLFEDGATATTTG